MTGWREAVRAAIRDELGPQPVRCHGCGQWFARPADLEPWIAAQRCGGCQ